MQETHGRSEGALFAGVLVINPGLKKQEISKEEKWGLNQEEKFNPDLK